MYKLKNKNELFTNPQNFVAVFFLISPLRTEFIKNLYLKF